MVELSEAEAGTLKNDGKGVSADGNEFKLGFDDLVPTVLVSPDDGDGSVKVRAPGKKVNRVRFIPGDEDKLDLSPAAEQERFDESMLLEYQIHESEQLALIDGLEDSSGMLYLPDDVLREMSIEEFFEEQQDKSVDSELGSQDSPCNYVETSD